MFNLRFFYLITLAAYQASAWYVPELSGVHSFAKDDEITVYTNVINSDRTQLPYAYANLNFVCPGSLASSLNLGEILRGDRIHASSIKVSVLKDVTCATQCSVTLTDEMASLIARLTSEEYKAEWMLDDLPSGSLYTKSNDPSKRFIIPGFKLGNFSDDSKAFLYNHFDLTVEYNKEDSSQQTDKATYSIVGFEVTPSYSNFKADGTCAVSQDQPVQAVAGTTFKYTFSVKWVQNQEISWSNRWDRYLNNSDAQVHWASILNSLGIITILTVMVALILARALHKDISVYNEGDVQEDPEEVTGWKMCHGDVFRPPRRSFMLTPILGTGIQLILSAAVTIALAFLGFLNPSFSGGLISTALFVYMFMGSVAGFHSARYFKTFRGNSWRRNAFFTAVTIPGLFFLLILFANFFLWGEGSSRAIPFGTMLAIMAMWFGISLPLVYVGAFFGYKQPPIENPCRTNQIPRQIPKQNWINRSIVSLLAGGALPFAVVFIELTFILSSVWQEQYYYMFGFLLLVFLMLIVTSIEISIVLVYFQLCAENYRWWWRAFLAPATSGVYVFAYSIFYYVRHLHSVHAASAVLFFSYSLIISAGFGLVAGTFGFLGAYWFVQKIYRAVKID